MPVLVTFEIAGDGPNVKLASKMQTSEAGVTSEELDIALTYLAIQLCVSVESIQKSKFLTPRQWKKIEEAKRDLFNRFLAELSYKKEQQQIQ